MLRFARSAVRANLNASRRKFSKNPNMEPPQIKKKAADPAMVDSSFKSTVTAFVLVQAVALGFFGVAQKMEDDTDFAKKVEQYYDIWGLQPTLETFRGIVQYVNPPKARVTSESSPSKDSDASVPAVLAAEADNRSEANAAVVNAAAIAAEVSKMTGETTEVDSEANRSEEQVTEEDVSQIVEEEPAPAVDSVPEEEPTAVSLTEQVAESTTELAEDLQLEQDVHQVEAQEQDHANSAVQTEEVVVLAQDVAVEEKTTPLLPQVEAESRSAGVKGESAERAMEEITNNATKIRQDLQSSLLQDLDSLGPEELRRRIQQLAAEFFERTKWEGVRMHEALSHLEGELSAKYLTLMEEQRSQLQAELDKALIDREKAVLANLEAEMDEARRGKEEAVASAVQAQAAGFHTSVQKQLEEEREVLRKQFEEEFGSQLAIMKHAHVQELVKVTDELDRIKSEVASFQNIVDTVNENQVSSRELHTMTAGVLALQDILQTSSTLRDVIPALKKTCGNNTLIMSTLNGLSARALNNGVATSPELRMRFKVVRKEVRKASLIPEFAPNFLGQAVGSALASISWTPSEGSKVESAGDGADVEEKLAAVSYHLDMNDLSGALRECNKITGYPRTLMTDWEACVRDRLVADQAVTVLKSELALQHSQMAKR